ncbi:cell division protein [Bacillus lacus]|uniref:Cell division protein n=1 Tax=Metabacillus lacus TaxID=1983721 RepID=A0A7X2LYV2_9BACI|nr:PDZ domain-containing protein [Metabacillus lacus]MRX72218.1 cell division protein [Metabacillus lacus]
MLAEFLLELAKAAGRFFLHPLLYYFLLFNLAYGYWRVKNERRSFSFRIQDGFEDMRFSYSKGLLTGAVLSLILLALGLSLPLTAVILIAALTAFLTIPLKLRWLSPAYTVGLALFAVFLIGRYGGEAAASFFIDLQNINYSNLALLAGLLILAEGFLVRRSGYLRTSPSIIKSSRGLPIGSHQANRSWMLPLLVLIPGGSFLPDWGLWPVLHINGEPFLLLLFPFFIGFFQRVQGSLPKQSILMTGKRILWLGALTAVIAVVSYWWTPLAFGAAGIAVIGRSFLSIRQRMNDNSASFYFSRRDKGLSILGILTNSPGEKMGLHVGEIIMKANGEQVRSVEEFYRALQKNPAFCKLEVIDINGHIRYVQGAIYEGMHHELGLLFVTDDKQWENAAV